MRQHLVAHSIGKPVMSFKSRVSWHHCPCSIRLASLQTLLASIASAPNFCISAFLVNGKRERASYGSYSSSLDSSSSSSSSVVALTGFFFFFFLFLLLDPVDRATGWPRIWRTSSSSIFLSVSILLGSNVGGALSRVMPFFVIASG